MPDPFKLQGGFNHYIVVMHDLVLNTYKKKKLKKKLFDYKIIQEILGLSKVAFKFFNFWYSIC